MMLEQMEAALEKAKAELSRSIHLEECGGNAGIRKMNANKVDWLKWVIYLAEKGIKYEKHTDALAQVIEEGSETDYQKAISFFQSIKNNF